MKTRMLFAPLVAAALLAAAVIVSPAADAGAAATKPCPTAGLVALAQVPGNGTAGSVVYTIEVTNLSGKLCTVSGYPKVSAVDLNGKRVGAVAKQGAGVKSGPVTLAQGDAAFFEVQIVEALNYPKGKCAPTYAAGLRISLPGSSGSRVAPLPFETCAKTGVETLSVGVFTHAH